MKIVRTNNKIYHVAVVSALLLCQHSFAAGEDRKISTIPEKVVMLTPDSTNSVSLDMMFRIPEGVLSKRSRIIIVPQLMRGDSTVMELAAVAADAPVYSKKRYRKQILEGYTDPYGDVAVPVDEYKQEIKLPYKETVVLPAGMEGGRIIAVVTTDGCGECTSIDTLGIAAITNPASLIEPVYLTDHLQKPYVVRPKVASGKGEARLQFVINRYDINLSLGNNAAEMDSMLMKLKPIVTDPLSTLESFNIYGMASADGSLAFNTTLSANRAKSARDWLAAQLNLKRNILRKFSVGSKPEGWQPVLEAMRKDGHPDTIKVMEILEKYADSNDDVQERYIRRLSCWNDIKERYLQKDRKVEYSYTYSVKSFTTDSELLEMYSLRPDAFNEDELLRVATLKKTDDEKKDVYFTTLKYFPQSEIAVCNLAGLLIKEGNRQNAMQAIRIIDNSGLDGTEIMNMKAIACCMTGNVEQGINILESVTPERHTPKSRYNLGLMYATRKDMYKAYGLLKEFTDVNSAVAALGTGSTGEAQRIMEECTDSSPRAEYVRAIIYSLSGQVEQMITHLRSACNSSPVLKERAKGEIYFDNYRSLAEMKQILSQ